MRLARTLRAHREGILAAIHLGLANAGSLIGKLRRVGRSYGAAPWRWCAHLPLLGIVLDLPR